MTVIDFTVPAIPVAQPRQRHRVVTFAGHTVAANYTPAKAPVNAFKASVRQAFADAYQGPPLDCPVFVRLVFVFPRPSNRIWKTRAMPREPHAKKPDVDNVFKSLADSLNGLLWIDDSQVVTLCATKWIASGDEQPHVEVRIEETQC